MAKEMPAEFPPMIALASLILGHRLLPTPRENTGTPVQFIKIVDFEIGHARLPVVYSVDVSDDLPAIRLFLSSCSL